MFTQNKPTPEPSIATLAPGTVANTSAEGQPQRKPSEKKTSIFLDTSANLKPNQTEKKLEQSPNQPKLQAQSLPVGNVAPKKDAPNQPKKSAQGGILGAGTGKDEKSTSSNLISDSTIEFGLKTIIDSMVNAKRLEIRQIQKIQSNFKLYVREKSDSLSLQPISQNLTIQTQRGTETVQIIKLFYMNQIEQKSKLLLNLFWGDIIKAVCVKLPFLSVRGCFEITKLHIGMNKNIYCQAGNEGTFQVKKFSDPKLYPILNDKITTDSNHPFFKSIQSQVENLCLHLFKGMRAIFKEMSFLRTEPSQKEKYGHIFDQLQRQGKDGKSTVIKNLFSAFENMITIVNEQVFDHYIVYFECVVESLWNYYLAETELFDRQQCLVFLRFLNDNYIFFNSYGMSRSQLSQKFVEFVEKLALSFLFRCPLKLETWTKVEKNLIFDSKLEMFEPFKYLLDYGHRQEIEHPKLDYPLRGIHWKEFIDNVISLRHQDSESINFIINSLESFLVANADLFWSDPSSFESEMAFCLRYNSVQAGKCIDEQLRIILLNMLRIASSLMGLNSEESRQGEETFEDVSVEYPESRRFPYALKVHHQFSELFMKIGKKEFLQILSDQIKSIVIESTESQYEEEVGLNDLRVLKPEKIVKTYLLKLISSEPSLLFQLKKHVKELREEDLVNFLVFKTIKNPNSEKDLLNLAYTALDSLLINTHTSNLIENILGLGELRTNKSLPALVQRLFINPEAITFVSRHCNILIDNGYQAKEWTKELLKTFYKNCQQSQGSMLTKNHLFTISYSRLLSSIIGRLNLGADQDFIDLKPFVNVAFIIESIKAFLKFDKFGGNFINVIVQRKQKEKIEALMESIRLFSSVLLYCFKGKNVRKTDDNLYIGSLARSIKNPILKTELISPLQARQLGIQDKQFHTQVNSLTELTTSYANALSFILINSTFEQKKLMKSVNFDYETLVFQTIETLVKLNPREDIIKFFIITKGVRPLSDMTTGTIFTGEQEKSLLERFLAYIEQSLNEVGIEIVVFGNLIPQPQRLRRLIDKVRNKLQSPAIRERIKPLLLLKIISTLSRYFRNSMLQLSLHDKLAFTDIYTQEHFEYLLQSIVEYVMPFKSTRKPYEATIVDDTLANLYGGFLTVQTFAPKQFLKWIKNYHALLLHDVNLRYLRNVESGIDGETASYTLGEEYFKMMSLFLNCDQYLAESDFNIIAGIPNFSQTLSTFILNISHYSNLSRLPTELTEILLEILTMAVKLYTHIDKQPKNFLTNVITDIKNQKLPASTNLILLEIELYNHLNLRYSSEEIDFTNMDQWPLQMNCVDLSISTPIVRKIISSLKKSTLSNTSFVSVCNGLMFLLEHSDRLEQSKSILVKDLFDVFKYFSNLPETTISRATLQRSTSISYPNQQISQSIPNNSAVSYKRVWILELLLTILTNSDLSGTMQKVEYEYESLFTSDEFILKRFGLLMRKLAYSESEIYMNWLPQLDDYIQAEIIPGQSITFAQKMQLNQILKMFNYILANHSWTNHFADGISDLIETFVMYRKNFEKLISSQKKPKAHTSQQTILEVISISSFVQKDEMMKSAIKQLNKDNISVQMLKSSNCFELMHEIINIELTTQYALICATIAQPQHLVMFRKNPLLSDASKWNIVLIEMLEPFAERHIEMARHEKVLKGILKSFTEICYEAREDNIEFSNEMLFTNSQSLSCCLNTSFDQLTQVLIETLQVLLETAYGINQRLQQELHSDYKPLSDKFNKIVQNLKRNDKNSLNWGKYDPSERKAMITQTVRTNVSRTLTAHNSYVNVTHR